MKKMIPFALLMFFLLTGAACSNDQSAAENTGKVTMLDAVATPFSAPNAEIADMEGKKRKMSEFRGKPVIVNFWATWCPPCRAELPSMNNAWAKLKNEDIVMLAVNMGESEDMIEPFTLEHPIDFTILLDKTGQYALDWRVKGLPTTYIVNPDGQVVYQAVGGREWDDDKILDVVRALKKQD